MLTRTVAAGIYEDNYVLAAERGRRLWHIRAKRVVLATGALERPLVFPGNDLPGVMLAGAAARYDLTGLRVVSVGGGIAATFGAGRLEGVIHADGRREECDVLAVSGGWSPNVSLWSQAGGRLRWDDRVGAPVPAGGPQGLECAGKITGAGLPDAPRFELVEGDDAISFVDLERDSTVADLRRAIGAGLRFVEHVKRYTTIGTGSDQGKTRERERGQSRRTARDRPARARHDELPAAVRPALVRACSPAATAVSCSTRYAMTPIHPWHIAHGAVFENVGQWQRPAVLPAATARAMEAAVLRECPRHVRASR